jgi:hypothetical protein
MFEEIINVERIYHHCEELSAVGLPMHSHFSDCICFVFQTSLDLKIMNLSMGKRKVRNNILDTYPYKVEESFCVCL